MFFGDSGFENDVALTCFCQKNLESRKPRSPFGGRNTTNMVLGREKPLSRQCSVVLPEARFLQLNASSTAVITVFGDNTNAARRVCIHNRLPRLKVSNTLRASPGVELPTVIKGSTACR